MKLDRNKLDMAMVRKNFKIGDLVKAAKLSEATISRARRQKEINHRTAYKICKALGTDISEIIDSPVREEYVLKVQ